MTDLFTSKVAVFLPRLMTDLSLTLSQGAGVFGNIGHECAGFRLMQEVHPVAGRGGYGWCQWTGPRRVNFESFCRAHGLSPDDDEANYRFLLSELRGPEAAAVTGLRATSTLSAATETFCRLFERPGVVSMGDRLTWATKAVAAVSAAATPAPVAKAPVPSVVATVPVAPAAKPTLWSWLKSKVS